MINNSADEMLQDAGSPPTARAGGRGVPSGGIAALFDDPAGKLRDQAVDKLRGFADMGKTQVTDTFDGVVHAAREIANKLQDGSFGPVGGIATQAADALEHWTRGIKDKSIEDLMADGRHLVRRSPAVMVGLAVAAGFTVSRFLKAGNATRYGR